LVRRPVSHLRKPAQISVSFRPSAKFPSAALQSLVSPVNTPASMISPKKLVFGFLSVVFLVLASGCTSPRRDTSIPWSRPADWEGQIPGMGSSIGR
jgi:hypothetical protein